ncbi:MAG: hypothetical protein WBP81_10505 [Solirubrobacteraceae bacterium]
MTDELRAAPEIDPTDRPLAERLDRERPVPVASFRGSLRRYLVEHDPGYGPRPERLRAMVTGYLVGGGVLLALGALYAVGVT